MEAAVRSAQDARLVPEKDETEGNAVEILPQFWDEIKDDTFISRNL